MNLILIQFDTTDFWKINWYYPLALIVAITSVIIAYKNFKKKPSHSNDPGSNSINDSMNNSSIATNTNSIPINIVNNINSTTNANAELQSTLLNPISDENLKATTKILFVDDQHTEYKNVSILKKAGWIKTKSVKDITNLDNYLVVESDIIFVDINGVGLSLFDDQGLGLASALKKKYPHKKIVIYSAETTGDRFHEALRQVDYCLPKNADAYQFSNLIENLLKPS